MNEPIEALQFVLYAILYIIYCVILVDGTLFNALFNKVIILEAYYHSYETSTHVHSASITHFMYLQEKLVLQEKKWAVPPP